jgi:hypothetical protein
MRALVVVALLTLVVSCSSDDIRDLVTVDVDVDIDRQTVPGLLPLPGVPCEELIQVLPGLMQSLTIRLADEEELQGEDVIGNFESVKLDNVTLDIVDVPSGDSDNWDFIDSVRLFADDPSTVDPPVLVAELDPVPQGITTMVIPGLDVELVDIASAENFVVSGEVTGRIPCDEVHFQGEAKFDVELF